MLRKAADSSHVTLPCTSPENWTTGSVCTENRTNGVTPNPVRCSKWTLVFSNRTSEADTETPVLTSQSNAPTPKSMTEFSTPVSPPPMSFVERGAGAEAGARSAGPS